MTFLRRPTPAGLGSVRSCDFSATQAPTIYGLLVFVRTPKREGSSLLTFSSFAGKPFRLGDELLIQCRLNRMAAQAKWSHVARIVFASKFEGDEVVIDELSAGAEMRVTAGAPHEAAQEFEFALRSDGLPLDNLDPRSSDCWDAKGFCLGHVKAPRRPGVLAARHSPALPEWALPLS